LKDAVARAAGTESGPALADICQDLEDLLAEVD
jgi:hypothetical protein